MKTWTAILVSTLILASGAVGLDEGSRRVLERIQPDYPEFARRMNLHGTVKVKAWVSPDGIVRRTEYVSGHPMLAESALKAVRRWRFQPADKETIVNLEVSFE